MEPHSHHPNRLRFRGCGGLVVESGSCVACITPLSSIRYLTWYVPYATTPNDEKGRRLSWGCPFFILPPVNNSFSLATLGYSQLLCHSKVLIIQYVLRSFVVAERPEIWPQPRQTTTRMHDIPLVRDHAHWSPMSPIPICIVPMQRRCAM